VTFVLPFSVGTVNDAANEPELFVLTAAGVVVIGFPANCIVIVDDAAKTCPDMVTTVPPDPVVGFKVICGRFTLKDAVAKLMFASATVTV
jgi:hypothetical protein